MSHSDLTDIIDNHTLDPADLARKIIEAGWTPPPAKVKKFGPGDVVVSKGGIRFAYALAEEGFISLSLGEFREYGRGNRAKNDWTETDFEKVEIPG